MSTLTIPNVFVTGTTINAAPFNANFSAIQTWSANIDNTNIGAAGLFPSQLLPTTSVQGTFGAGAAYTFPTGVTFSAGLTATTGSFSGAILSTLTTGAVFSNISSATIGQLYIGLGNTGNTTYLGIESSVGGTVLGGSSAYATVFGTYSAQALQFATSNVVRQTITAAGLAQFTGAVQAGSATAGTATAHGFAQSRWQ